MHFLDGTVDKSSYVYRRQIGIGVLDVFRYRNGWDETEQNYALQISSHNVAGVRNVSGRLWYCNATSEYSMITIAGLQSAALRPSITWTRTISLAEDTPYALSRGGRRRTIGSMNTYNCLLGYQAYSVQANKQATSQTAQI